jgi:hypothetical protein
MKYRFEDSAVITLSLCLGAGIYYKYTCHFDEIGEWEIYRQPQPSHLFECNPPN